MDMKTDADNSNLDITLSDDLFGQFDDLIQSPLNRLMEKAIQEDKIPIGYTCSYIPRVIMEARQFVPYRVIAPWVASTEIADTYLPSIMCSYTRSMLEYALNGHYDFLKGWIATPSCQHMSRFFDNLKHSTKPPFTQMIDLPHKITESAVNWMVDELNEVIGKMSAHFDVTISDQHLNEAINRHNDLTGILKDIGDSRKTKRPSLTGAEFHKLVMAWQVSPADYFTPLIVNLQKALAERQIKDDYRARVILVGGNMDNPDYIDLIEGCGALVVADRICTGSLPGLEPYGEGSDPVQRIAEHAMKKTSCPRMMDDYQNRLKAIVSTFEEYKADGVIIETIKFCDTWGLEARELTDSLRDQGVPVLKLEREYRITGQGQLKTRVQAFLESMGK